MEIEIYSPSPDEMLSPVKWNYEELKAQLVEGLAAYKGRVYDEKSIGEAKKDRAALNKLAAAIDTRRKEMKERYLAPYQEFEAQAKELAGLVKEQSAEIDAQVKAFDEKRKAEKLEQIKEKYAEIFGELAPLVPYDKIHNKKWLNVTTSMASIEDELSNMAASINLGISTIDMWEIPDDMREPVKRKFLDTLDLGAAMAEKERIERERQALADYEAAKAAARSKAVEVREQPKHEARQPDPHNATEQAQEIYTVDFRVYVTSEQMQILKAFLIDNGIRYGRVPR